MFSKTISEGNMKRKEPSQANEVSKNTLKKRRQRERIKSDPERYKQQKEKDRERKKTERQDRTRLTLKQYPLGAMVYNYTYAEFQLSNHIFIILK